MRTKIGLVGPRSATSPHYNAFKAIIPEDVQFDFVGLELAGNSLYELKGKKEIIVRNTSDFARKNQWQGVIVSAAPVELLNPGLLEELRASLQIPVTTALLSCVAALRTFSARRVLLMTPFDEPLNKMIRDYLTSSGIDAVSPLESLHHYTDALKLSPEEVFSLTRKALEPQREMEAIYFQGAVLDPLKVIGKIEKDLHTTVVASNPVMLWFILSKLGLSYEIRGCGKFIEQWPELAD